MCFLVETYMADHVQHPTALWVYDRLPMFCYACSRSSLLLSQNLSTDTHEQIAGHNVIPQRRFYMQVTIGFAVILIALLHRLLFLDVCMF